MKLRIHALLMALVAPSIIAFALFVLSFGVELFLYTFGCTVAMIYIVTTYRSLHETLLSEQRVREFEKRNPPKPVPGSRRT